MIEVEKATCNSEFFRPNTLIPIKKLNVLFNMGGLGDFICRIPPLRKLCIQNPHVKVELWVPEYFYALAKNFMQDVPQCELNMSSLFKDRYNRGEAIIDFESRLVRPLGINLMEHAHHILLSESVGPEDLYYPHFNTGEISLKKFSLPNRGYVVVTTAATSPTRALKSEIVEGIVDHIKEKGLTPMFLGKNELVDKYKALFPRDVDYTRGLDYRNQTSITEAAELMSKAKAVVGLDNGLLHLAACTDVPVVFGFTTVKPEHRICNRRSGKTMIVAQPDTLSCRYCQSNMKALFEHDFRNCLYRDFKCLDQLTAEMFNKELDKVI